jgi:phosphate uptake regulator
VKIKELAQLVKQMREAQRQYFKERSPQWLSTAKELERRVDKEVMQILDSQKELF